MSTNNVSIFGTACAEKSIQWCRQDTIWMLSIYGTAIGAGTLFLPINAGMNGLLPLLVLSLLAFPMTYLSHRALCRFVLSSADKQANITAVVDEHFGRRAGLFLTILYFLSILPIILLYSVGFTNTAYSFIQHQLGMAPPPRSLIAIIVILCLMGVIRLGHYTIIKAMSYLVFPFILILLSLSLYLIPHWNTAAFSQGLLATGVQGGGSSLIKSLWLGIPVIIFSFNHLAIISSFAVSQRERHAFQADKQSNRILKYSHMLMIGTALFFVFSCVLSFSPAELHSAKVQNISILSYLANRLHHPFISYGAPIVAFIAISKSFLGHYIGASEGLRGLIIKQLKQKQMRYSTARVGVLVDVVLVLACWLVATINPSILGMIEVLGGPLAAVLLFIMPMYAMFKVPAMKKYRHFFNDTFTLLIGIIALSAMIYGLI